MADALRTRIAAAIVAAVKAAALPGIGDDVFDSPTERATTEEGYPCAVVRRRQEPDQSGGLSFTYGAIGHPFEVLFKVVEPLGTEDDLSPLDVWQERLLTLFQAVETLQDGPAGVREVFRVDVRPLKAIDPRPESYQRVQGGLVLIVWAYHTRGL